MSHWRLIQASSLTGILAAVLLTQASPTWGQACPQSITATTPFQKVVACLNSLKSEVKALQDAGMIAGRAQESVNEQLTEVKTLLVQVSERLTTVAAGPAAVFPKGAVVAFATTCPSTGGWSPYKQAEGRFILGVGKGPLGKFVGLETPGGEEKHTLTIAKMPEHVHHREGQFYVQTYDFYVRPDYEGKAIRREEIGKDDQKPLPEGESKPHNNMPPNIALYFCKKD